MAAPVFESVEHNAISNGGTTDPCTVTKPTGTASGDLLIAFAGSGLSTARKFSTPSGWTLQAEDVTGGTVGGSIQNIQLFYKVAGGSEPSTYDFTPATTNLKGCVAICRVSGAEDPATTALVHVFDREGAAGSCSSPSVTPTDADSLVIRNLINVRRSSTGTVTFPSSTEQLDAKSNSLCRVAVGSFTNGASSTGTETVTYTPTSWPTPQWGHIVVAIAPTAGGSSGSPAIYYHQLRAT